MGGVSISNPVAQGLEGVSFSGTLDGVQQQFVVAREGLEDLEYTLLESPEAMLQAFHRQQAQVALVAAKAMREGPKKPTITLLSLLA